MEHRGREHVLKFQDGAEVAVYLSQVDQEEPKIAIRGSLPAPDQMTRDEGQQLIRLLSGLMALAAEQPEDWPFTEL